MTNVRTSPIKQFPGSIRLIDPVVLPAVAKYEQAMLDGRELTREYTPEGGKFPVGLAAANYYATILPGVFAIVEGFEIEGIPTNPTVESFPYKPKKAAELLVAWLVDTVKQYVEEDNQVPPV